MLRSMMIATLALVWVGPAFADDDVVCGKDTDQRSMNICADRGYHAADKKLNTVFAKVIASLEEKTDVEKLRAAQRAWIVFRDAQCTFETAENEGGSIYPMEYSICMMHKTEARTAELQSYLDCQNDEKKCP